MIKRSLVYLDWGCHRSSRRLSFNQKSGNFMALNFRSSRKGRKSVGTCRRITGLKTNLPWGLFKSLGRLLSNGKTVDCKSMDLWSKGVRFTHLPPFNASTA